MSARFDTSPCTPLTFPPISLTAAASSGCRRPVMKTLRAFVHKLFRRRKADTAGASGNERSFPVKPAHGFLLTYLIGQKVTLALCHKPSHFSEVLTGVVAISVPLSNDLRFASFRASRTLDSTR